MALITQGLAAVLITCHNYYFFIIYFYFYFLCIFFTCDNYGITMKQPNSGSRQLTPVNFIFDDGSSLSLPVKLLKDYEANVRETFRFGTDENFSTSSSCSFSQLKSSH